MIAHHFLLNKPIDASMKVEPGSARRITQHGALNFAPPYKMLSTGSVQLSVNADLTTGAEFTPLEPGLTFHVAETSQDGLTDRSSIYFSTSYKMKLIAPTGQSHKFFVSGLARNGDSILEYWEIKAAVGSTVATAAADPAPLGVSSPSTSYTVQVIGGTYLSPDARVHAGIAERLELFRGSHLQHIRGVAGDPDARYALAMAGGNLYRFDVSSELAAPVEIDTHFEFLDRVDQEIFIREFAASGARSLLLPASGMPLSTGPDQPFYCLAFDQDNDGHFEFPGALLDTAAFVQLGLLTIPGHQGSGWSTDYVWHIFN